MKIYSTADYKTLPWKNGKGFTRELLRLNDSQCEGEFLFRLSQASISQDGPFSLFPGIDRILILLKGNGVRLQMNDSSTLLEKPLAPFSFPGEETVKCELIKGACEDFNIMTKRGWRKIKADIIGLAPSETYQTATQEQYLYLAAGKVKISNQEIQQDGLIHLIHESQKLEALDKTTIIHIQFED